jgi:hypothetical protein
MSLNYVFLMMSAFIGFTVQASPLPPQNVIFITVDGVRYKDIYKPEQGYDFLDPKNGFPLLHFMSWSETHNGVFFGTQDDKDEMEVGNTSCKSLPGYKAIFSGMNESECTGNYDCGYATHPTLVDHLIDHFRSPRDVALFSSWKYIEYATEGQFGKRAVQSIGLNGLQNLNVLDAKDRKFSERYRQNQMQAGSDLPDWENSRKDQYTWDLATDYLKTYEPRFLYLSMVDTDEWGHKNNRKKYFQSLNHYDDQLMSLIADLNSTPEGRNYLKNTSFVISTDHGRGGDWWSFREHGTVHGLYMRGSENVWSIIVPSQTLLKRYLIERSKHGEVKKYSQLDLRPTIETLLEGASSGQGEGESLIHLLSR